MPDDPTKVNPCVILKSTKTKSVAKVITISKGKEMCLWAGITNDQDTESVMVFFSEGIRIDTAAVGR